MNCLLEGKCRVRGYGRYSCTSEFQTCAFFGAFRDGEESTVNMCLSDGLGISETLIYDPVSSFFQTAVK